MAKKKVIIPSNVIIESTTKVGWDNIFYIAMVIAIAIIIFVVLQDGISHFSFWDQFKMMLVFSCFYIPFFVIIPIYSLTLTWKILIENHQFTLFKQGKVNIKVDLNEMIWWHTKHISYPIYDRMIIIHYPLEKTGKGIKIASKQFSNFSAIENYLTRYYAHKEYDTR